MIKRLDYHCGSDIIISTREQHTESEEIKMTDYSKIFEDGDMVYVHFHDVQGKEFKTRDYGHPHPVSKENGKVGIYFFDSFEGKPVFKPFESFATTVTFERVL